MKPTLILILERARAIMRNALNRAINETALPAYLIEGLLLELLAEVRAQKVTELAVEHEEALRMIPPPTEGEKEGSEQPPAEAETESEA